MFRPLKIGNVEIPEPVILAPMAGVSDLPFRTLCREQGAGMVCMEMVSAKAILYKNRNTEALMQTTQEERPVSLQLFGSEPETVAAAAEQIEEKPFDILDFNMGCPVPKVVGNHEGSALMNDPHLAGKIIAETVKRIRKPVTVKIRKGFDADHVNAVETARILEDAGAAAIAVHGRTREQFYSGKADWDIIRQVKEAVSVPVIGNGDVTDGTSAREMLEYTGCDGIMIGRAARGDPWIFRRVTEYLRTGREIPRPALPEVRQMILRHVRMLLEYKGEYTAIREMRKHVAWYTAGWPHSASLRRRVNEVCTAEELEELLDTYM